MTFADFHLSPHITAGVNALGYQEPTPIQQESIPPIMAGRDVMGLAQTGTGKTAAFAIPILQRLESGPRKHTRALIVAPTRELAEQIHQSFRDLGSETRLRSVAIYGGVSQAPQVTALRAGTEIVVACPGRLLDHIHQGHADLSHVEVLVLDEADRMFDMGFLPDVRRIIGALPLGPSQGKRQTLLFSATMPDDIRGLAGDVLFNPLTVQIGEAAPADTVSHVAFPVPQHLKTALLTDLLADSEMRSVLVFTRTKHRAKKLGEVLERAGFRAASLQGNLSQNARQAALDGFRGGKYRVLVATDIAARGIDVTGITHVINYDMPDTTDAYTHRIGRTGRAERCGTAYTFMTPDDAPMVRLLERLLGAAIERRTLPDFDYGAAMPEKHLTAGQPDRRERPRSAPSAPHFDRNPRREEHRPAAQQSRRSDRGRSARTGSPLP